MAISNVARPNGANISGLLRALNLTTWVAGVIAASSTYVAIIDSDYDEDNAFARNWNKMERNIACATTAFALASYLSRKKLASHYQVA